MKKELDIVEVIKSNNDHLKKISIRLNILEYARKSVIDKMNKLGERMYCLAQGIREHGKQ